MNRLYTIVVLLCLSLLPLDLQAENKALQYPASGHIWTENFTPTPRGWEATNLHWRSAGEGVILEWQAGHALFTPAQPPSPLPDNPALILEDFILWIRHDQDIQLEASINRLSLTGQATEGEEQVLAGLLSFLQTVPYGWGWKEEQTEARLDLLLEDVTLTTPQGVTTVARLEAENMQPEPQFFFWCQTTGQDKEAQPLFDSLRLEQIRYTTELITGSLGWEIKALTLGQDRQSQEWHGEVQRLQLLSFPFPTDLHPLLQTWFPVLPCLDAKGQLHIQETPNAEITLNLEYTLGEFNWGRVNILANIYLPVLQKEGRLAPALTLAHVEVSMDDRGLVPFLVHVQAAGSGHSVAEVVDSVRQKVFLLQGIQGSPPALVMLGEALVVMMERPGTFHCVMTPFVPMDIAGLGTSALAAPGLLGLKIAAEPGPLTLEEYIPSVKGWEYRQLPPS